MVCKGKTSHLSFNLLQHFPSILLPFLQMKLHPSNPFRNHTQEYNAITYSRNNRSLLPLQPNKQLLLIYHRCTRCKNNTLVVCWPSLGKACRCPAAGATECNLLPGLTFQSARVPCYYPKPGLNAKWQTTNKLFAINHRTRRKKSCNPKAYGTNKPQNKSCGAQKHQPAARVARAAVCKYLSHFSM